MPSRWNGVTRRVVEGFARKNPYERVLYSLYSLVVFNLNAFVVYSFCSLSFLSFLCRQKGAKNLAHGKNLHKCPLLRPHNVSLRSCTCSSLQAFACFQGAAKLVPHGCIRKITAMLHSNILTQWPENKRPCVGFFNGAVLGILPVLMKTANYGNNVGTRLSCPQNAPGIREACHVDRAMRRDTSLQHTESIKNTKLYPLYSTVVFNLNTFILYFHQVF